MALLEGQKGQIGPAWVKVGRDPSQSGNSEAGGLRSQLGALSLMRGSSLGFELQEALFVS